MNKEKVEIKELNVAQLREKIESLRRELFNLKLNASTAHVKDYSQFEKLRRNIARAETYLRQRTHDAAQAA